MKTLSHIIPVLPMLLVCAAQAQPVYRCGNTYTSSPCDGGTSMKTEPGPTREQKAAAAATAQREQQLSREFEQSRHAREAEQRRQAQASASQAPKAAATDARKNERPLVARQPPATKPANQARAQPSRDGRPKTARSGSN